MLSTSTSIGSCNNGASTHTIRTTNAQTTLQDSQSRDELTPRFSKIRNNNAQSSTTQPRSPRKEIAYERQLWLGPATHGGVRRIEARGGKSEGKATHGYGNSFERARSRDATGSNARHHYAEDHAKRRQPTYPVTVVSPSVALEHMHSLQVCVTVCGACPTLFSVPAKDWLVNVLTQILGCGIESHVHSSQTHPLPWNLMSGRALTSRRITTTVTPSAKASHTPLSTVRPMLFCVGARWGGRSELDDQTVT